MRAATYSKTHTSKEVSVRGLLGLIMSVLNHASTPAEDPDSLRSCCFSVLCKCLSPLSSLVCDVNCLLHLATLLCYVANIFAKKPLFLSPKRKVWRRISIIMFNSRWTFCWRHSITFSSIMNTDLNLPYLRSKYYLFTKYVHFTW